MTEKYITYKHNGEYYDIPESLSAGYEEKFPDATIEMHDGEDVYDIPIQHKSGFLNKFPNATYAFDEQEEEKPSFWQRLGKHLTAAQDDSLGFVSGVDVTQEEEAPKVDNELADAVIKSNEKNKKEIDKTIEETDKAYYEKKANEPKKSFWQKLVELPLTAQENEMIGDDAFSLEMKQENREKGKNYTDALIAKNITEKTDKKIEQYEDPAKTFVGGVLQGAKDSIFDLDTWDQSIGLEESARVLEISKKLENGQSLTKGEQMIIDALVNDLASDVSMAAGFGRGYKAGKVTGESLPFMVETFLNPASGLGEAITKKFGKQILKKVSNKALGKAALYATRVGADVAGASIMAATTSQARVSADAMDRLTGEVDFSIDEDGGLTFNGFVGGEDSALKAYGKAFGSNTIDHFSEMVGNYFGPLGHRAGRWSKKQLAKAADAFGMKKIANNLRTMTPNGFGAAFNDFLEQTQWNGPIGEFAEEMVGGTLNALIIGDQELSKDDLFSKDNLIDTFLGVAIMGGVISGVKTLGYTTPETQYNRAIGDAKRGLEGHVSAEEMGLLEAFANNPFGTDYANLELFFGKDRKKEDKEAVGRYLAAVAKKQGYEISRNAQLSGTQQGMQEMQKAFQLGQNMTEADLYDVNQAYAEAENDAFIQYIFDVGLEETTAEELRNYSSYDLFRLSQSQDHNLSEDNRRVIRNLAIVKNAKEGLDSKLASMAQASISAHNFISTRSADKNGRITKGMVDGKIVYVKGDVKVENGSIVKPEGAAGYPVTVVDSMTGETMTVNSDEVGSVENLDVNEYNLDMADTINSAFNKRWSEWSETKSTKSKLNDVQKMVGAPIYLDVNGKLVEVEVNQILPNGEVLIKGKKGDLGGQSTIRVDVDSFYDSLARDEMGRPIYANQDKFRSQTANINAAQPSSENYVKKTGTETPQAPVATEVAPTTEPTIEPTEPEIEDFNEMEVDILINGVPVKVEVTNQDDVSGRITYRYTDANGDVKIGGSTIADFRQAVADAKAYNDSHPAPQTDTNADVTTTETSTETAPEVTTGTETTQEVPITPQAINWDELFEQDKDAYLAELQNQFGDDAVDMLNAVIDATQQELDSLNDIKGKPQNEIFEIVARNKKLQAKINSLNDMVQKLTATPEVSEEAPETPVETEPVTDVAPETETTAEEEVTTEEPVAETTPEPIAETPAPVAPNPVPNPVAAAKEREAKLLELLNRNAVSDDLKADAAKRAGKEVADMFATYEEYEAYEAEAADLGEFVDFFDEGVKESFATRNQQNNSDDGLLFRSSSATRNDEQQNIQDELAEIKEKAIANGTFMKAPNGQPTKLNEKQWLLVRTKNFINWFGDWKQLSELSEIENRKLEWLSKENLEWAKGKTLEEIIEKFGNEPFAVAYLPVEYLGVFGDAGLQLTDNRIYSGKGYYIDHAVNHHPTIDPKDYINIQDVINNYDHIKKVRVDNKESIVFIKKIDRWNAVTVQLEVGDNGRIVWHKNYYNQKKEPYKSLPDVQLPKFVSSEGGASSISPTENSVAAISLQSRDDNAKIENFLNPANISKVVDENGEPLVVYHGTGKEFYTFRNTSEDNELGSGFYFTDSYNTAERYAKDENLADNQNRIQSRADDIFFDIMGHSQEDLYDNEYVGDYNLAYEQAVYELFSNSHVKGVFLNIRKPYVVSEDKSGVSIYNGSAIAHHNNDGIIDDKFSERHDTLSGVQYVAFSPNQIKSATDNVGTFNPENNDIRFRRAENNSNFVEQFEFKQNNESKQFEYSDEFRGVQEESARMSEQLVSEYHRGKRRDSESVRQRLGGAFRKELDRARSGRGYKVLSHVNESKGTSFDIIENVDGRLFHDIFEIARKYLLNGELVDLHENYNDAICYITTDGLAGFAIDKNGNLVSVYSLYGPSKRGFLGAIKGLINEAGATHLDGYNSAIQPLAKIYSENFGWKVASMMDYNMEYDHDNIAKNHGMPQVAFMVNTDADIETKHFNKDQYDEAVAYQQAQVEVSKIVAVQNAAVDYLVGEARNAAIENAVNEEASKLGVKVTYKTREQMPDGHENDKGYYNTKTGEIVVCTENASSIADAIQTILHESVAHKGLRQLMGEKFNEFINRVYNSLDAETKAKVDALAAKHYDGKTAVAMEEYMATLAESENFADISVWDKIKSIFEDIINAILGRNDIKIGDNELRYILRASYNNMVNPRGMETVRGWAQDQMMREEYKINQAETPEIMSRTGIDDIEFTTAQEAYEQVTFRSFTEIFTNIRVANGIKAKMNAIKTGLLKVWNEYQMEHQDSQQAVLTGIEAIQKETGNIPIEDFENYYLIENQMQGRSAKEIENFNNKYKHVISAIRNLTTAILESRGLNVNNKKLRADVEQEIRIYVISKSGLERNEVSQSTKTRKLKDSEKKSELTSLKNAYDEKVSQINADTSLPDVERELELRNALDEYNAAKKELETKQVPDIRDYSGLTGLWGLPETEFREAERLSREYVDSFESKFKSHTDELWERINSVTQATLLHAFKCGLISRSVYEKIKNMYKYYVPLRGFDETTAENVYDYANYDGNRFQPVIKSAGGRTSVAFDPFAVIAQMGVSGIIQGNKNLVKQALYNFVGNRPNSLLSIRDCWYVLNNETGVFEEAYPDLANGETWEAFENRMKALAEEDKAVKRTKNLDIGYRFQKPINKNEHYIHVMINGVEKAIFVNGNPRLAEGVNGFKDYTSDILKKVKRANRWVSQLFTNYSYKFGAKNFFRDFGLGQVSGFIKKDAKYAIKFSKNWAKNGPAVIGVLLKKYSNGTLDMNKETQRLFKEFVENGGQTGFVFIDEIDKLKKKIDNEIQKVSTLGNKVTNVAVKVALLGDIIQYGNECFELAARFNTYVTSRTTKDKNGNVGSILQSIDDAKTVTANFNKKGAQSGRGFIGGLASILGSSVFFYNAGVQSIQMAKSWFDKSKTKTILAALSFAGLGYAIPYIISILNGDDDDERYWNIPEYERKNNICIPFENGTVMHIPLTPTFADIYACGVTLSDAHFNKKIERSATDVAMQCAVHLAKAFIPANPLEGVSANLTALESLAMFAVPDMADPLMEIIINKDYRGMPLEYKTTFNEGAPHYTKVIGKDNWKEKVGEKLYKMGEDNLDSKLDLPLYMFEHLITSSAGGIGTLIEDVANTIQWVFTDDSPENLSEIPVARILLSSNAKDDERFVNNTYWQMRDIYDKRVKSIQTVYGLTPAEAFGKKKSKGKANLVEVYEAKIYPWLKEFYEQDAKLQDEQKYIDDMPNRTEEQKNVRAVREQNLFNMRRKMVEKLLEYDIE